MSQMPVLFISHGPPVLAVSRSSVTQCWADIGRRLGRPDAIVCISAHFEATVPLVSGAAQPDTIHDFGGPPELFALTYPCPGEPTLAERIHQILSTAQMMPRINTSRGLDHGVWVPLLHLFPDADVPVVQVSIQTENGPRHHYDLGRLLGQLRGDGVLVLASGGAVHNLDEVHRFAKNAAPPTYARAFDDWLFDSVSRGENESLLAFESAGPQAQRCHPWPAEHFLPLLVASGAAGTGVPGRRLFHGFLYGVLSMAAYLWH